MTVHRHLVATVLFLGVWCAWARPAAGEDVLATLADRVARMRTDVEALAADIEEQKADAKGRLRTVAAQKAELEVALRREQVRLIQVRERKARHVARVARRGEWQRKVEPVVRSGAEGVIRAMESGVPFRLADRRREVRKLLDSVDRGMLAADAAAARLWEVVEDELRLARESGLYTQEIDVEGKRQLVEVARVGMVMLYFRTSDGRYGAARRDGGAWGFGMLTGEESVRAVAGLFEAFKRQLRTGLFRLPNTLPPLGAAVSAPPANGRGS